MGIGDSESALNDLNKSINLDRRRPSTFYSLSRVHAMMKDLDKATSAID